MSGCYEYSMGPAVQETLEKPSVINHEHSSLWRSERPPAQSAAYRGWRGLGGSFCVTHSGASGPKSLSAMLSVRPRQLLVATGFSDAVTLRPPALPRWHPRLVLTLSLPHTPSGGPLIPRFPWGPH